MNEQTRPGGHLVERVAERLLRSGALESSAANLLGRASPPATPTHPTPPALEADEATQVRTGLQNRAPPEDSAPQRDSKSQHEPIAPAVSDARSSQTSLGGEQTAAAKRRPVTVDPAALEAAGMLDASKARTRMLEEFRLLQRQILQTAFGEGAEHGFSNLLMVTSARPGEGKSFTSLNLAGSIARQADNFVLLIDGDSKRDSLCHALGLEKAQGLLDLVANPGLDAGPLIVKTPIRGLSILPVGRERDRCAELFPSKEMVRLVQSVARRYADRLIILDAPPCLSTTDPAVLAPVVGQILFVVEANRTQRDEVEASLDLIQACPNISLVLNKQQQTSRYTFGAYSSYYAS